MSDQDWKGINADGNARQHNGDVHGNFTHNETNHIIQAHVPLRALTEREQEKKNNALLSAARHGQNFRVERLIVEGADPDYEDCRGYTALHWTCCYDHVDIAEMLIRRGVDLNAGRQGFPSPLYFAAAHGHLKMVELLLRHRARLDGSGPSPLSIACFYGHLEIVTRLVTAGLSTSISRPEWSAHLSRQTYTPDNNETLEREHVGAQPLHFAVASGHLLVTEFLLINGAPVDTTCTIEWKRPNKVDPRRRSQVMFRKRGFTPLLLAKTCIAQKHC